MKPLYTPGKEPMKVAGFMSGIGTNLRNLICFQRELEQEGKRLFEIAVVFTEKPQSNAKKIASEFGIPYIENDICRFYEGKDRKDMELRRKFDLRTINLLNPFKVDCIALCGYDSITTGGIFSNFVTLNVHPADLTIKDKNGKRKYAGAEEAKAVYNALKDGRSELRSTIILVDEGADTGPILVLSAPLKIKNIPKRDEDLIKFSKDVQELQKRECDWPAYRMAVKLLAEGRFAIDEDKKVFLDGEYIENGYVMK